MTTDEIDEYLWSSQAPTSLEVAALERQLRPLAWRPRELPLPDDAPPIELARAPRVDGRGSWIPVLAGVAAAAAVLALMIGLRGGDEAPPPVEPTPQPVVQPAASPSPDLVDPFSDAPPPGLPAPSTIAPELQDPFGDAPPRRVSPDLKDPFANSATSPSTIPPAPTNKRAVSPDLVDPFKSGGDAKRSPKQPGKLYDPFTGKESKPPSTTSPDLKDPFKR